MDWPMWNFLTLPVLSFCLGVHFFEGKARLITEEWLEKRIERRGQLEEEICDVDRKTHVQITFSIDLWFEMVNGKVVTSYQSTPFSSIC